MQQSNRYKIAVYAISKNEARFAKRWMHTMREADVVIVADTGSTDDTVSLLREAGAEVHRIQVTPWRFDKARNESLRLVPDDIDICVCTDLDEVWEEGWRSRLERNWRKELPGCYMPLHMDSLGKIPFIHGSGKKNTHSSRLPLGTPGSRGA